MLISQQTRFFQKAQLAQSNILNHRQNKHNISVNASETENHEQALKTKTLKILFVEDNAPKFPSKLGTMFL